MAEAHPPSRECLTAVVTHLHAQSVRAELEQLRLRYDLAHLLHQVHLTDPHQFAGSAIQFVGGTFALHPSEARRYVQVRSAILEAEFEDLLALRDPSGRPLTWSHLEQLARVRQDEERIALAHEAAEKRLSVRDLAARVRLAVQRSGGA